MTDKKKLIIDCDPGIDDSLALMMALASEEVDVRAITAVFGNADTDKTFENILKVLSLSRARKMPPIGKGAQNSLSGKPYKPRFVHGVDGLGNTNLDRPKIDGKIEDAKNLIMRTLSQEKIDTVVTLGPLTNIARVLIEGPAIKEKIGQIVLMGGAVYAAGNVTKDAEFNIYQDAEAAKVVINSKIPIKLVSLDATRKILYTKNTINKIKHRKDSDISNFIQQMFKFALDYHKKYRQRDGVYLPDVLAMCVVLDEEIGSFKDLSLDVDIEKDIGKTFVNLKVKNEVKFLEEVDTDKAVKIFIDSINKLIG